MDKLRYAILEAEICQHYDMIKKIYDIIADRQTKNTPEGIDSIAYHVHNLYGAYEELFESIARFFENNVESTHYHTNLLFRMRMDISGMRPALLSEHTYKLLDEMRRFRHFFRHAYGVELNKDLVIRIAQIAIQLKEPFRHDMERFLEQLKPKDD